MHCLNLMTRLTCLAQLYRFLGRASAAGPVSPAIPPQRAIAPVNEKVQPRRPVIHDAQAHQLMASVAPRQDGPSRQRACNSFPHCHVWIDLFELQNNYTS